MEIDRYVEDLAIKYGWVQREMRQGASILDVGCGQDQPLLYVLSARLNTVPDCYLGVDLNHISKKAHVKWAEIWDEFNFVANWQTILKKYTPFDKAVCFEVIEHMMPEDGKRLLEGLFGCLRPGGTLYLSTPVFNGYAAANHIREYTIPELKASIEQAGFELVKRYGTFASKPEIRDAMSKAGRDDHLKVWDEFEPWFGNEVMSCIFAALYPNASRNNIWKVRRPENG